MDILDRCRSETYVMSCYSKSDDLYAAMKQTLLDAGNEIEVLRAKCNGLINIAIYDVQLTLRDAPQQFHAKIEKQIAALLEMKEP